MDVTDIHDKLASLLLRMSSGAGDDTDQLKADIHALEDILHSEEVQALLPEEEREDMAGALGEFIKMLDSPDLMNMMADAMATPPDPNPEICDAIDAGDVAGVRAALDTWDVNTRFGEFGSTALYHAMSQTPIESLAVIEVLLDAGADPRIGLGQGNVLHGLGFGHFRGVRAEDLAAVIRRCVALGADLEQRTDKLGWTPLIGAASEWNDVATEALLLAGADINARAGEVGGVFGAGQTAAHFADGHEKTSAVLRRYARPN